MTRARLVARLVALVVALLATAPIVGPATAGAQAAVPAAAVFADTTRVGARADVPRAIDIVLGPGDLVRITVWRKPELSGEFTLLADGSLAHPLYRGLRLGGVPFADAEEQVRAFLSKLEKNPQFVLEPLVRVAVSGEVARPNVYSLRPETSVAMAVALAGGPTALGRRDRVRVLRESGELLIDLSDPARDLARTTTIRSGDQIVIERRRALFREYVAPAITVAGATAAILNVMLRYRDP